VQPKKKLPIQMQENEFHDSSLKNQWTLNPFNWVHNNEKISISSSYKIVCTRLFLKKELQVVEPLVLP